MNGHALPALFALFVWWFSTGLIIFLDGLPRHTFKWSMLGATALLGAALWTLHATAGDASTRGAYAAFAAAVLVWGWLEISFYTGTLTGPRTHRCPHGCAGPAHFGHAIMASLWHELAILVAAAIVVAMTWGHANTVGMWTFVVLWWMHQSARLNVFLGVPNLSEEVLPAHMAFLASFFRKAPMNLLFPVSVSVCTVVAVVVFQRAFAPGAPAAASAAYMFIGTIMALAVLEHWFLVLPLPSAKLWRWSMRADGADTRLDTRREARLAAEPAPALAAAKLVTVPPTSFRSRAGDLR